MSSEKTTTKISKKDLPVSCPQKGSPDWAMHPRVYIELANGKSGACPYCGAKFELLEG